MTNQTASGGALEIVPIGGHIGAEARGVHLSGDLPLATIEQIRQAISKHKVVIFRGQDHLDDTEHQNLMAAFGELAQHPTFRNGFAPKLDGDNPVQRANTWHCDITFLVDYTGLSSLRPLIVPDFGGDTMWANTVSAYEDMPEPLRHMADELRAIHSNVQDFTRYRTPLGDEGKAAANAYSSAEFTTEHPVVRVIPETGEAALILGATFRHFVDFPLVVSHQIFNILQSYIEKPEHTFRWRWKVGDIAFWDNRVVQHYGVNDYGAQKRVVCTVRTRGDVPVGRDGRKSVGLAAPATDRQLAAE